MVHPYIGGVICGRSATNGKMECEDSQPFYPSHHPSTSHSWLTESEISLSEEDNEEWTKTDFNEIRQTVLRTRREALQPVSQKWAVGVLRLLVIILVGLGLQIW